MKLSSNSSILFVISGVLLGCVSCDVVSTFSVQNKSKERKRVEVVGIEKDSVSLEWGPPKSISVRMAVVNRNNEKPSCSFYLEPNQTVWLEWGWGNGYSTRQVIVNHSDTIQTIKTVWRNNKPPKNKYLARKKGFRPVGGDYQVVLK